VEGRLARYRHASTTLRAAISALGLPLLLDESLLSNTITCAHLPENVSYKQIHDRMREDGYVIYAGQGDLATRAFRVSNMGLIPEDRLAAFAPALRRAIS